MLNRLLKQTSWIATLLLVGWLALHLGACLTQSSPQSPMAMSASAEQSMTHHGDCCDEQQSASTGCDQLSESITQATPILAVLFILLFVLPFVQRLIPPLALHFWLCLYSLPIRSGRPPSRLRFCIWRN